MRRSQVLIYLSFLLLNISFAHESVDTLLKNWCNNSAPDLCISTVAPHIKGKPTKHDALDIAIKAAIAYTEKTISVGKESVKNPPPSVPAGFITGAVEMLEDSLHSYKKVQVYLKQHQYGEIGNELSAVSADIDTALNPAGPDPDAQELNVPVFTDMLHKCIDFCAMCLNLVP